MALTLAAVVLTGVGFYVLGGCRTPICDPVTHPPEGIHLTTGGVGGVYARYGEVYRNVLRIDVPGLPVHLDNSDGSVDNIERLVNGEAQLGFISADTVDTIARVERRAGAVGRVCAVARVYDEYVQVVVRANSVFHDVADLRGRRVSTGSSGSSVEITARRLLAVAGLDIDRDIRRHQLGVRAAAAELRDGRLDAFFWVGGLPTDALTNLAEDVTVRLLPIDRYADTLRQRYGMVYRRGTVPAGTYPRVADTRTIAIPSFLLATTELSDDLVFRLTRALFVHQPEIAEQVPPGRVLDVRSAINTTPVPLHPGAKRYYRSVKP